METNTVSEQVLNFYSTIPFNVHGSIQAAAEQITKINQLQTWYADLHTHLSKPAINTYLDAGCGIGWLSNTLSYYYRGAAFGIDFNPRAIEIAQKVSALLQLASQFQTLDIFSAGQLTKRFDAIISMGVLHHTSDTFRGLEILTQLLSEADSSILYIGLYHLYGRRPFLGYFESLKRAGKSEEELFNEYCTLHANLTDRDLLYSWFRDQVLHPCERSHTLEEVAQVAKDLNLEIISTSINRYQPYARIEDLFTVEKGWEEYSVQRNLVEKRYFPGFFTVCMRRRYE